MTIGLTTSIAIPNATKVEVADAVFDEDGLVAKVKLRARTAPATDLVSQVVEIEVRDADPSTPATAAASMSQKVARAAAPSGISTAIVQVPQVAITSGYTNLRNAWYGAANSKGARRRAAETQGLADGWIDSSLAGTVS
jgi:hypothetical protein